MVHDVIIIGAGPAGMLAGWFLEKEGLNYCILDKGKKYFERQKNCAFDVSYGFGGAGLFSDGKLSYAPSASNLWTNLNPIKLRMVYEELKKIFKDVGIMLKEWDDAWVVNQRCYNNFKAYDSLYLDQIQRMCLLQYFYNILGENVNFEKEVIQIEFNNNVYEINCKNDIYYKAKNVIIATGKMSPQSLIKNNTDNGWKYLAEMGVRIEINSKDFLPRKNSILDYKIIERIDEETEKRTFCSCINGVIRTSLYSDHITYNGESIKKDTKKSNIGLVVRTKDINSVYAKEMKECYNRNKTSELSIKAYANTDNIIGQKTDMKLKDFISEIIENKGCDGKVVGPEIEKYGYYPELKESLKYSPGLYFAGDCVGSFRGLMAAFLSGGYAASLIIETRNENLETYMQKLKIKKSTTENMKLIFTAQSKVFFYCRDIICQYVFDQGYLPINPFRVFSYFLNDRVDRNLIRQANNQLIKTCEELWVFGNISDGVLFEVASAMEHSKKIRFFTVGTKIEDIKEINTSELSFEPEVHAKQIKKQDIIDFINDGNLYRENEKGYQQITLFDYLGQEVTSLEPNK